jgi:hypothetical protein
VIWAGNASIAHSSYLPFEAGESLTAVSALLSSTATSMFDVLSTVVGAAHNYQRPGDLSRVCQVCSALSFLSTLTHFRILTSVFFVFIGALLSPTDGRDRDGGSLGRDRTGFLSR